MPLEDARDTLRVGALYESRRLTTPSATCRRSTSRGTHERVWNVFRVWIDQSQWSTAAAGDVDNSHAICG